MYKNIIISLDIMQKAVYDKFMSFSHLQFKPAQEIWKFYPKTGKNEYNPQTMFNEAPIVESLLLLDYIKEKNIKPIFWYNSSLFIFNDALYSIKCYSLKRLVLKKDWLKIELFHKLIFYNLKDVTMTPI